jgi:hypothetical protein
LRKLSKISMKKRFIYVKGTTFFVQGGGNAGSEQDDKLKVGLADGLAWVPLTSHLFISCRFAVVAPEDL